MLILSRKIGQSIVIDSRITVRILRLEGDVVKLGIDAPREVPVHRQEVYEEIQKNNQAALTHACGDLPRLSAETGAFADSQEASWGQAMPLLTRSPQNNL